MAARQINHLVSGGASVPVLLKPRAVAAMLQASPAWLYGRIADGSLRSVKLAGRVIRVRREDLLEFINRVEGQKQEVGGKRR